MTTPADRASKCDIKQVVAKSLAKALDEGTISLGMVEGLHFCVNQVFIRNGRIVLLGQVKKGLGVDVENGVREFVLKPVAWQQPKAVSSEAPPLKAAENLNTEEDVECALCGSKWDRKESKAKWGVPGVWRNTAEEAKDDNQYTLCRDCEKYTTMDPDTGEFFFTAEGDRLLVLRQRLNRLIGG